MKLRYHIFFCFFIIVVSAYSQQSIYLYQTKFEKKYDVCEKYIGKNVITDIVNPRMVAYYPADKIRNGTAVLICPGGAYTGLVFVKEGQEIAKWFTSIGVTAFLLYYRLPNGVESIPLQDAQKAITLIRGKSKQFQINKNKVGIIGFSAGGHLASTLGTHFKKKKERPDFMVLCYPVISMKEGLAHKETLINLLGKEPTTEQITNFSNELNVTHNTPPTFLVHAKDDKVVSIKHSELFDEALTQANVPHRLLIYEKGGHGFAMRTKGLPIDNWNIQLKMWLKEHNFIKE